MMERMVSVWSSLLGNSIINVRTTQLQVNFNSYNKMLNTQNYFMIKFK
jgi:hypothetical protein